MLAKLACVRIPKYYGQRTHLESYRCLDITRALSGSEAPRMKRSCLVDCLLFLSFVTFTILNYKQKFK